MKPKLFIYRGESREALSSLESITRIGMHSAVTFDRRTDDESVEAQLCPYYGFKLLKGVTHLHNGMTILGVPRARGRGLHGAMLAGIDGVDGPERIYSSDRMLGFGLFIRWAAFVRRGSLPVIGIDYAYCPSESFGVAQDQAQVAAIISHLVRHGIPGVAEARLLGGKMLELPQITQSREGLGLHVVRDWFKKGAAFR